jgi:putative nucleotidyltransferase with HDIG domain
VIGRLIGNYRIVTELGGGAMGQVYFAEHTLMGRRAAIKVIRDELSTHQESVQRFINEARLVNRIGHPNIVEITDFGQIDSRYYIMMELLEGETLEELLGRSGRLDEAQAIAITIQVADAVRAAHELGVVHRDLKPENIYLTHKPGHEGLLVKVLDFGIAKLMHGPGKLNNGSATVPGAVLGTPQYMSPEQCQGDEHLDHRSDVYSLGVVLYRMLTGNVPFLGDSVLQIMMAHIQEAPTPPRELRREISLETEAAIMKAMQKKPEDRFADMLGLRSALERRPPSREGLPAMRMEPATAQPMAAAVAKFEPKPAPHKNEPVIKQAPLGPISSRTALDSTAPVPIKQAPPAGSAKTELAVKNAAASAAKTELAMKQAPLPATKIAVAANTELAIKAQPTAVGKTQVGAGKKAERTSATTVMEASGPLVVDVDGQKRVGSRLGQIVVERIRKGKLTLPALPSAARDCLRMLDAPDSGLDRVARIVANDPVIAPQVLKRARSALLGRGTPVRTVDQAVARLGSVELRSIVMDLSTRQLFESKNAAIRKLTKTLWEHSTAVAVLARSIARHTREVEPEVAYLAGLLHDVGKPIAASLLLELERSAEVPSEAFLGSDAWIGVINECHREVGVALARSWELNDEVQHAIARSDRYSQDKTSSIVCLANALAKRAGVYAGPVDKVANDTLIREGQTLYKLDEPTITNLLTEMRNRPTS